MPGPMECEGKTVEAAVEEALGRLGIARDEAEITVLQEPSAGFLGLFAKKARVRVTKREAAPRAKGDPAGKEKASERIAERKVQDEPLGLASAAKKEQDGPAGDTPARSEWSERSERSEQSGERPPMVFTETQEMQADRAVTFLQDIIRVMELDVTVERKTTAKGLFIALKGESVGILIGKHGQTLDSLQYLTNLAANRGIDEGRIRVVVDVEDYRARREETLVRLAHHLAEKACRLGQEVHLEPMNRHERRIIHTALLENRRVTTYSDGEEPRRYVVIAPKRRRGRRQDSYEGRSRRARVESTPELQEPYYERGEY